MLRLLASTALAAALALPAHALDLTQMSDAEREAFRTEIRDYLLDNPQVIMEAVALLEQRQQEAQAQADVDLVKSNADALFADDHSWVGGNPEGDVTVVEFLDYTCGYCRHAFPELTELVEGDGNIRLIIKEFPIRGEEAVLASRFAIATLQTEGEDAYKNVHDALITFEGDYSEAALTRLATSLDLDADAIIAHMASDEVSDVIDANYALGREMDISGTPTFVMGDQMVRGYVPLEAMQQIVAAERQD
ncbi:DsbA family protein [Roseovarius sp. SCSIO 43702]|uniref:DsbA family protein n=1 Tax=Roseovarius sp. SCSIO 43702 TaxID=2823043 RepID=UPI001C733C6C|nr:DsbA family protein [Roseovarius sp. SCSIO 43702]QYX55327.1 DsbA family protein [Roseovarius sp. SCSIO 43702]